jgi:hypothetical protein
MSHDGRVVVTGAGGFIGLWEVLEAVLRRVAHQRGVLYLANVKILGAIKQ